MINKKLYSLAYWRNDGEWHTGGLYDQSPIVFFEAEGDAEARQLAYAHISENTRHNEDVHLRWLKEIKLDVGKKDVKTKEFRKRKGEEFRNISKNIEDKLEKTNFTRMEDVFKNILENDK